MGYRVSADAAKIHAERQYELFHTRRLALEAVAENALEELENQMDTITGKSQSQSRHET